MRLLPLFPLALGLALLVVGRSSLAQTQAEDPAGQSTLTRLASDLKGLRIARPALIAVTRIEGAPPGHDELMGELGTRILQILGSQVPGARQRLAYSTAPAAARQRARTLNLSLVLLRPRLADGLLHVTVDVIEWPGNIWDRSRLPEGTVTQHLALSAPADTEIRQFLPRPPNLLSKKQIFRGPTGQVLALACGAPDPQGGQVLLVVGRRMVFLGRFVGSSFVPTARRKWEELSPLSPHPLRAALASATIELGEIWVGSSDRSDVVLLDPALGLRSRGDASFPLSEHGSVRCHQVTQTGMALAGGPCATVGHPTDDSALPETESADALAHLTLTNESGATAAIGVSVTNSIAHVVVSPPASLRREFRLPRVGAQIALADLDGDQVAELISSKATFSAEGDGLLVHRITEEGATLVEEVPTGPVSALAVCPFSGTNPQTLIAAAGNELWVLR